ncbi:hypothetical protein Tco_0132667 [Tanacetum coccineum]
MTGGGVGDLAGKGLKKIYSVLNFGVKIGAIRGDQQLSSLPKPRMTKQGNPTHRTPQAKKQSDHASRQISKQASGSANAPHDIVFTAMGPILGTTQATATTASTEGLQLLILHPLPNGARDEYHRAATPTPSKQGSRNYETLVALIQEETKKRSSQSLQARLNFGPEDEVSPPRHQKERRGKDNRRPPVFGRIGRKVSDTQTANLQNLDTHEHNDRRISVRDRLGSRDVHSRLGQRRSPSDSPPSSDSEDSRHSAQKSKLVSRRLLDNEDGINGDSGNLRTNIVKTRALDMSRPWRAKGSTHYAAA